MTQSYHDLDSGSYCQGQGHSLNMAFFQTITFHRLLEWGWYFAQLLSMTPGSGHWFLVHTGNVHGGFAVLLSTSCYEFVIILILYCITMLNVKYACCTVDMCCAGWGWILGEVTSQCPFWGWLKAGWFLYRNCKIDLSNMKCFHF